MRVCVCVVNKSCVSSFLFNISDHSLLTRESYLVHWRICLPVQETQKSRVQSLGREDPLEEGMATHSSILAWRIPWTEEPCGLQSVWLQRVRHDWATEQRKHYLVGVGWEGCDVVTSMSWGTWTSVTSIPWILSSGRGVLGNAWKHSPFVTRCHSQMISSLLCPELASQPTNRHRLRHGQVSGRHKITWWMFCKELWTETISLYAPLSPEYHRGKGGWKD